MGIRTPDLLHAMEARYQLRHSPALLRGRSSRSASPVYRTPGTGLEPFRTGRSGTVVGAVVAEDGLGEGAGIVLGETPAAVAHLGEDRPAAVRQTTKTFPRSEERRVGKEWRC